MHLILVSMLAYDRGSLFVYVCKRIGDETCNAETGIENG